MARTLRETLLLSLHVKGGETTCAITLDGSSDQDPSPLIGDFFNSIDPSWTFRCVAAQDETDSVKTESSWRIVPTLLDRRHGDLTGLLRRYLMRSEPRLLSITDPGLV